ncbi:MAG: RepB family plasmid replication initiator protein [Thiothrix sp.]|nr:MAG: RepB family plasmid replication initiator protein [Thiothrix sp.]
MDKDLEHMLKSLEQTKFNIEARTKNTNLLADQDPNYGLTNNSVTKSHALSRAYYRFSLVEKRCMEALISKLHPLRSDNNLQEIELSALEYAKAYNVPVNIAYRDLASAVHDLMRKVITADRPNGKEGRIEFTVMSKAEYKADEGKIVCAFNSYILPYLLKLSGKFSSYPLKQTADFSSSYTWRFYEILISWAQPKDKTNGRLMGWINSQPVDELREMLGVPKSYTWKNFEHQVLNVASKELLEKACIGVFFERVKTNRKITHLNIKFIESDQTTLPLEGGKPPKKPAKRRPNAV